MLCSSAKQRAWSLIALAVLPLLAAAATIRADGAVQANVNGEWNYLQWQAPVSTVIALDSGWKYAELELQSTKVSGAWFSVFSNNTFLGTTLPNYPVPASAPFNCFTAPECTKFPLASKGRFVIPMGNNMVSINYHTTANVTANDPIQVAYRLTYTGGDYCSLNNGEWYINIFVRMAKGIAAKLCRNTDIPVAVTNLNIKAVTNFTKQCLGTSSRALVGSWNGDTYQQPAMLLTVSPEQAQGSITTPDDNVRQVICSRVPYGGATSLPVKMMKLYDGQVYIMRGQYNLTTAVQTCALWNLQVLNFTYADANMLAVLSNKLYLLADTDQPTLSFRASNPGQCAYVVSQASPTANADLASVALTTKADDGKCQASFVMCGNVTTATNSVPSGNGDL